MDRAWFEMKDIRRRHIVNAVWVPLMASQIASQGEVGMLGWVEEFFGVGTLAVPTGKRADALKLGWTDLRGPQGVWATKDLYKPADVYQAHQGHDLGVELALCQQFSTNDPSEWHLNQDVVMALGLRREGDVWVRPAEDYCEVSRLRRNSNGRPNLMEMKNEFLRDYLGARNMLLRIAAFYSRTCIVQDLSEVGSPVETKETKNGEQYEHRNLDVTEGGFPGDGTYAVFHVGRNDVDADDDVPQPGPPTNENTVSKHWTGKRVGRKFIRPLAELWRDEVLEPAALSLRVRGDKDPTDVNFIVDASGKTETAVELHDEDRLRWLWFRPEVIPTITKKRSGSFSWYTEETGGIGLSSATLTHFGLNKIGLVNVYAYDIARLPPWQQRIWAGFNVAPDGGVSAELLSAQAKAVVAETYAPEWGLPQVLKALDAEFIAITGSPLFRPHEETQRLIDSVSRFRALEPQGIYALAKDLMRLVGDRIDAAHLHKFLTLDKSEKKPGSLKSLERYLASFIGDSDARNIMGPLFGAYDLRLADAHLPSQELADAFNLVQVDPKAPPLAQGFWLIVSVVETLNAIGRIMAGLSEST
jgi:hypothetical protein